MRTTACRIKSKKIVQQYRPRSSPLHTQALNILKCIKLRSVTDTHLRVVALRQSRYLDLSMYPVFGRNEFQKERIPGTNSFYKKQTRK